MITSILLFAVFLNFIASIFVISRGNESFHSGLFCIVSFFSSIWAFTDYMMGATGSIFLLEATYASSLYVAGSSLIWVLYILNGRILKNTALVILSVCTILAALSFAPSYLFKNVSQVYLGGIFRGTPGVGFYIYAVLMSVASLYMLIGLYRAYKKENDSRRRFQAAYIFLGGVTIALLAIITEIILPQFGIVKLAAIPSIALLLFLVCTAYSIIRRDVVNLKITTAELTIFSLWSCMLVQICTLETFSDQVMGMLILAIGVTAGIRLRRSVVAEIEQQEELSRVAEELRLANREIAEANGQLIKLSAQKSEFLSFATHQLRNPLSVIYGYIEKLSDNDAESLSKNQKDAVKSLRDTTKQLSKTITDFLNVSKIDQGGMQYEMNPFDLSMVVSGLVREMEVVAEGHGLDLSLKIDYHDAHVRGDREKVRQALSNIVDNAIKYTPEGGIRIRVFRKNQHALCVEVRDTGIGIPPELKPALFEKFKSGIQAKVAGSGSGLGLYLAKEIIEAHDGQIIAESAGEGKGATFYISLPAENVVLAD